MIDHRWYEREGGEPVRISAGGVVVRILGANLLVALVREREQNGIELDGYVLPKGGIEPGEDLDTAARREIEEEAGLTELEPLGELSILERQNFYRSKWSVNHYRLYLTSQVTGAIRDLEHHFGMAWFPLEGLPQMFWPDERRMLEQHRMAVYERVIAFQNPKARKRLFM